MSDGPAGAVVLDSGKLPPALLREVLAGAPPLSDEVWLGPALGEDAAAIRAQLDGATLALSGGSAVRVQHIAPDGLFLRTAGPNGSKVARLVRRPSVSHRMPMPLASLPKTCPLMNNLISAWATGCSAKSGSRHRPRPSHLTGWDRCSMPGPAKGAI